MKELDFDRDELSIPAKEILEIADKYIDAIEGRHGAGIVKKLPIHWQYYDDLDRSIRFHTEDNQSIKERTYRGAMFFRDSGSWE